jgi:hypothetical protein
MTRKPMTTKADVKRYLFAGDARISVYNNISKNTMVFNVHYIDATKKYSVSTYINGEYFYLGKIKPNYKWEAIQSQHCKVGSDHPNWRVFCWILRMLHNIVPSRNDVEISIYGDRCSCCGKPLKDTKSLERGFGPHCWKKVMEKEKAAEKKHDSELYMHYFGSPLYKGD